jgi:dolichyl-phosphate-mannose--protein O-mannosyl transferase
MPALMYAELLAALTMDRLFGAWRPTARGAASPPCPCVSRAPRATVLLLWLPPVAGPKYMPIAARLFLLTMVAGFAYFMPWIYALPLSQEAAAKRRWLPRWD